MTPDEEQAILDRAHARTQKRKTPEKTITAREIYETLGISHTTLIRYVKSGKLTKYRTGTRNVLFDAEQVDALKKTREIRE